MTSSLSDHEIEPGRHAERGRGAGRRWGRRRLPPLGGNLEFGPLPLDVDTLQTEDSKVFRSKRRHVEIGTVFAGLVAIATAGLVGGLVYRGTRVDLNVTGVRDDAVITTVEAAAMEVKIVLPSRSAAKEAKLRFDGAVVEEPDVTGKTLVWHPAAALPEGRHVLQLAVPRPLFDDAQFRWAFTVDGTAPGLMIAPATDAVAIDADVKVPGVVEKGARVTANGDRVRVADDGRFTLHFDRPPVGPVTVEARDRAGNVTTASLVVPITTPGLRGVHVTGPAWSNAELRGGILALADEHRIDTVVLDLKDESGVVVYDSNVARASEIGSLRRQYDLDSAVTTLHSRGIRVIGRISAFRDPILARAAWGAGQNDQVVQTADGDIYDSVGPYTNPASLAVRDYNLDIARDAVTRGVDGILWDDVRLPTGRLDTISVPGMAGSPSDTIVGFLAEAHGELRRRGAYQGVIVDGESATQGDSYGQDVARVARNADYVAPEIYPGYWQAGRFGVPNPARQPGDLVRGVLAGYQQVTAGTGAALVPWLQDFAVNGVAYGEPEVRAQIDAVRSLGVDRYMLWSPSVRYTGTALDPMG